MGCTQAEILRLLRLIEKRVIEPARDIEDKQLAVELTRIVYEALGRGR